MPNKFEAFANTADQLTQEEFKDSFSSLTRLTDDETAKLIKDTGISHKDLAEVLKEVKKSTDINDNRAKNIKNINKGVEVLLAIAKKFI